MVTKQNLKLYEGNTDSMTVTIGDGNEDITDYIVYFTVKADINDADADAVINRDVTIHSDPIHGITIIPIYPEDTKGQPPGDYPYDIRYDDGTLPLGTNIFTVVSGKIKITQATGDLD